MRIPRIEADTNKVYQEVQEITTCKHETVRRAKKTASNGVITVWQQCAQCGDKVGKAIPKTTISDDDLAELPDWDPQIGKQYYQWRSELYQESMEVARMLAEEEWNRRYEEYLDTPEWKEKRRLVLLRAQGVCEGCRIAEATEVHHLTYSHAGEEFLFQLVAICGPCHKRFHTPPPKPVSLFVPRSW